MSVSASDLRNAARIAREVGMPISADGLAQFATEAELREVAVSPAEILDERDRWRSRAFELEAENRHLANNLDVARMGRATAEARVAELERRPHE